MYARWWMEDNPRRQVHIATGRDGNLSRRLGCCLLVCWGCDWGGHDANQVTSKHDVRRDEGFPRQDDVCWTMNQSASRNFVACVLECWSVAEGAKLRVLSLADRLNPLSNLLGRHCCPLKEDGRVESRRERSSVPSLWLRLSAAVAGYRRLD